MVIFILHMLAQSENQAVEKPYHICSDYLQCRCYQYNYPNNKHNVQNQTAMIYRQILNDATQLVFATQIVATTHRFFVVSHSNLMCSIFNFLSNPIDNVHSIEHNTLCTVYHLICMQHGHRIATTDHIVVVLHNSICTRYI